MLLTITGTDGAGKSSVADFVYQKIKARLRENVILIDRWDIFQNSDFPECDFITAPINQIKTSISSMEPHARALFIFWKIYTVMKSFTPNSEKLHLFDSYWIKHAAVEVEYGLREKFVLTVVNELPSPDQVIFLDISPELAYERKLLTNDLVPYECGLDASMSRSSFIRHQERVRKRLHRWAEMFGWDIVDAGLNFESVATAVEAMVVNQYLQASVLADSINGWG